MEQFNGTEPTTSIEPCPFRNYCKSLITKGPDTCLQCRDFGFHSLVSKLYLPRTLIPRNYLKLDEAVILESDLPLDAERYLRQIVKITELGQGIYCHSEATGSGKTTVGCIALLRFLYYSVRKDPFDQDNRRVLYLNTTEFLNRLRQSFDSPDPELSLLLENLKDLNTAPKLILFDDIGSERGNEWVQERLYELINFRISNGLAMSFTSNYTIEELEGRLGRRIASRIYGCSKPVLFSSRDYRSCTW